MISRHMRHCWVGWGQLRFVAGRSSVVSGVMVIGDAGRLKNAGRAGGRSRYATRRYLYDSEFS